MILHSRADRPVSRRRSRLDLFAFGLTFLLLAALATPAMAQSSEERLRALEQEVAALRAEIARLAAAAATPIAQPAPAAAGPDLAEVARRVELLAGEIEKLKLGEVAVLADQPGQGLGPAASKVYRTPQGLSIGGYGELLYQAYDERRDDGAPADRTDELDFLRGVVYFGYKFDDRFLFNSEIEYEHASTGSGGEVSVEFAYLDWLWKPGLNLRGGMVLVPMGFLNELHEPTTFLGARRPGVENSIIPTTWRENGFGLFGEVGPLTYRSYVVAGLDASKFTAAGIRGGRQKGARSKAEDFAWTGRVDYTAMPGLLAGVSAYVGGSGQGLANAAGEEVGDVRTTLLEGHVEWKWRGLELRALAVRGAIDDVGALNRALGLTGSRSVGERQDGWYVQAGYDLFARRDGARAALLPYARFEAFDTQAAVPTGYLRNPANDQEILTLGLAWRPIPQLILKADWQDVDNAAETGVDQLNVALGYIF